MESPKSNILHVAVVASVLTGIASYFFWGQVAPQDEQTTVPTSTQDHSSKEYATMGSEVWSAFECSAWASVLDDSDEANRLFLFGYEQGQTFLAAFVAGKITEEHIDQEIPIAILWNLQGPSEEFVLGKIYSYSQDSALEDVFTTGGDYNSEEMQQIIAGNHYRKGNCQFIGK